VSSASQFYLRDLLYLDADKAASIFSQIYGGLTRETQEQTEEARDRRRGLGIDLGLLKPEFASVTTERGSVIETRVLHHDLFRHVEDALFQLGVAVDLNQALEGQTSTREAVRSVISNGSFAYVRVEGWAVIEDYDRIKRVAGEFPALLEFIQRAALSGLEDVAEYKQLRKGLEEARLAAEQQKNRDARNKALRAVRKQEEELEATMLRLLELDEPPEEWLIEGIRKWIDVFLPGRITFRLYPFEELSTFQVLGNLKREAFADADLGNLLFAYGSRPNLKLTMSGLITSMPPQEGDAFNAMAEFDHLAADQQEDVVFERGFRGLFDGMEGLEKLSRFSRYPNITVYPLAVYRRVNVPADTPA
jgi:hypothetical protein